jgi:hypothetical protein
MEDTGLLRIILIISDLISIVRIERFKNKYGAMAVSMHPPFDAGFVEAAK